VVAPTFAPISAKAYSLIVVADAGISRYAIAVQPLKAAVLIVVTEPGITIDVSAVQYAQNTSGIVVKLALLVGKVSDARLLQLYNGPLSHVVTEFGMARDVNPELPNALLPIVVTLFGMVIPVKLTHPLNAEAGIVVNDAFVGGNVTDDKPVSRNALFPRVVIESGNTIVLSEPLLLNAFTPILEH
jgi:hypothetical protein